MFPNPAYLHGWSITDVYCLMIMFWQLIGLLPVRKGLVQSDFINAQKIICDYTKIYLKHYKPTVAMS